MLGDATPAKTVSQAQRRAAGGALPDNRGEVTVAMFDPWPGRKIRVLLPGHLYREAVVAHAARWWISCEGELTRQGSTHVLLNPRNFRVLPVVG